jgi:hypothetical protein
MGGFGMRSDRFVFACFVAGLGCCALVGGALTMEPAWIGKALQADLQREQDLRAIAYAVSAFEVRQRELPYNLEKLAEFQTAWSSSLPIGDPEDGQTYPYSRVDSQAFKLCANFKLSSLPASAAPARAPASPWAHPVGAHCFLFKGKTDTPAPDPAMADAKS